MSTRRTFAIAAAGALSLFLAACEPGADEPTPTSAAPTSEMPTTEALEPTVEPANTPSAVPPPNPAEFPGMDQQTEDGAKQAYRYFWAAVLYGHQTGDASIIEDMSMPECRYCNTPLGDVEVFRETKSFWGAASMNDKLLESEVEDGANVIVTYEFELSAHQEKDPATGILSERPAKNYGTSGRTTWSDSRWKLDGLAIDS